MERKSQAPKNFIQIFKYFMILKLTRIKLK